MQFLSFRKCKVGQAFNFVLVFLKGAKFHTFNQDSVMNKIQ